MYKKTVIFWYCDPYLHQTPLLFPDMSIAAFPQTSNADSGKARKTSPLSCRELS